MTIFKPAAGTPFYSGPNPWVKGHLQDVIDLDPSIKAVTFEIAENGVAKLGVSPAPERGFAAQAFAVFGNALASATTSGQLVPPMVILDQVGLNHASSNSGIVKTDGSIDQAMLAELKSFAKGKDYLTIGDLRKFLYARFKELQSGDVKLTERMLRFMGNVVLSRGEFGPLWAVGSIENPAKKGERILPLSRIDEFYDNKLFTRVRAEREAAMIVAGVPVHDGPGSVAGALAKFARLNGGPTTGNPADMAKYAAKLLEGRTTDDLERLREGIGLLSVAGAAGGLLLPSAKSLALALCPAFRGAQPNPPPAGTVNQSALPPVQQELNAIWSKPGRELDPNNAKDADLIKEARGKMEQLFNENGVGFKSFFAQVPGGFVTWPPFPDGDDWRYTFRPNAQT